ncbi:rRNA methyltransferase 3A, mitochondrial [Aulostomus maculatus]
MASYMRSMMGFRCMGRASFLSWGNGFTLESKRYVRGLRRRPVKVLFPEDEVDKPVKKPPAEVQKQRELKVTNRTQNPGERDSVTTRNSLQSAKKYAYGAAKNQADEIRFERALPGDKRLAKLVSVARSRTFREQQGKILLEGRRLICDALNAGANPQTVFFSTIERLRELPLDRLRRANLIKVKFEDIKSWSDVVAPQGVIAIFSRPDPSRLNFISTSHSVPLFLICDNIRDPGNLGTMLRSAAAAGCHKVLLTKGCVDVWEPKVLRAGMGAHFHLPIYPSMDWDDIEKHLPKSVTVHVADSSFYLDRSEDAQVNTSHKHSKPGDYGWVSGKPSHETVRYEESNTDFDLEDEGLPCPRLEAQPYHENWAQSPTALVLGGETHGLSVEAVQLAAKTAGQRLFIPIVPDVDSLNSAMAASILLFEGRKQLLKVAQTSGRK